MRKVPFIKAVLVMSMILTVSLTGFSKKKIVDSNWVTSPLIIDGSDKDWADSAFHFEKKVSVDYAFKNDTEYLYVLFKFKDFRYLSSIDTTGIKLWFNIEGKKKKYYGVHFTKKQVSADEFITHIEQKQGAIPEEKKNELRLNPSYFIASIEVIDKKNKSSSQAAYIKQKKPAQYKIMTQENTVLYEFAIPLERMSDQALGIGTEPGKSIKVAFEWGGLTDEMRTAWLKNRSTGGETVKLQSGGGKGGGSSESPALSARGPGGLTALRKRNKTYSFWVDVKLAQNK